MRRILFGVFTFAAVMTCLSTSVRAQAKEVGDGRKIGTTVANESLPPNLRLSVHVSHWIRLATDDPDSGLRQLKEYGLSLERADFELLGQLYGNFDAEQRKLQDRVSEAELSLRREEFLGVVLGKWLDELARGGHDGETFLRRVLRDSQASISISSDGPLSIAELEREAERFGDGFERGYGRALRPVLESRRQEEQP